MRKHTLARVIVVPFIALALVVMIMVLLLSASSERSIAQAASQQHPLLHEVIDTDTTWGPGVVTKTSDVVIKNGATLTVAPGTTVLIGTWAVPTDPSPYADGASDKVEIIVEDGGRLVADGLYTDTQFITPTQSIAFTSGTWGDPGWGGIRILGGGCDSGMAGDATSESVIRFATIEMAIGGIYIECSSPSISYNLIRQIDAEWGEYGASGTAGTNGTDGTQQNPTGGDGTAGGLGGDGTAGEMAYGIAITGTGCTPWIAYNTIQGVDGGSGGSGGNGGNGGSGGDGYSHYAFPGQGYDGGESGPGGKGGNGGKGGDAAGIYVHGASPTIFANQIGGIVSGSGGTGGDGGDGGDGGSGSSGEADLGINQAFPGGDGKDGGDAGDGGLPGPAGQAWGIYVGGDTAPDIRKNTVMGVGGRYASGGDGGDGGSGGHGGNAGGWASAGACGSAPAGLAGDGGLGGDGGDGDAAGSDVAGIYATNETQAQVVDNYILGVFGGQGNGGGDPGRGGDGGNGAHGRSGTGGGHGGFGGRGGDGGDGGLAVGIRDPGATPDFRRNTMLSVHGGQGGDGGSAYYRRGGNGGDGGDSACNGDGGDGGFGGKGTSNGNGGDGGNGVGILSDTTVDAENNVIYGILGGDGGSGGLFYNPAAGDGGDGGDGGIRHGTGAYNGDGGDGGDGGDAGSGGNGAAGQGMLAEGGSAAPRIVNNTIDRLDRGKEGEAGTPGAGGTGGVGGAGIGDPGGNGDAGAPGATAQSGVAGRTIGLHFTGGATGDVYNNIVVRTAYTDTGDYYVGTFTNSFGISATAIANLDYNDVWGWETNYAGITKGPNDISQDPLFADVFCIDCEDFGLAPGSPCIDAANDAQAPMDDRNGVLRPQDGDLDGSAIADIGAYEIITGNTFVILCDASGVFTTTDGLLTFGWAPGMCTTCTITVTYIPLAYPPAPTGDLAFGNLAFALEAVDCHGDAVVELTPTLSLSLNYDSLPPVGMEEATMAVYQWYAPVWTWSALLTTDQDELANTLTVALEHPGEFALLGTVGAYQIFLPLAMTNK